MTRTLLSWIVIVGLASLAATPAYAGDDDYAAMLGYLASNRIDGNAFKGASGAAAVNMAAGDLNQQANLRAFASGGHVTILSSQLRRNDIHDEPTSADVSIGGNAFAGGSGLSSINQASGSSNAQLNAVAAQLTAQGIREATDDSLSTAVSASAGGQSASDTEASNDNATRRTAVESSAMQGYQGVMQLNQAAGSGNATSNQLLLSAPSVPR